MQSVAQSRVDGHSTSGSPGLGLGSIGRMAVNFDIYTQVSQGTALRFEVWPTAAAPPADPEIELGVVAMAKPGEEVNGDAWHLHSRRGRHMLVIVDGLGHGPAAATAARVAINTALERPELSPQDQLARMHGALRPTRGAAASVASLVPSRGTGSFCGIGNVGCVVRTAGRSRGLVVHNGTLGHQVRKLQAYDFPFEAGAALIMHTDGLTTSWNLDTYPGLEHRHAGLVAAVLFRDCRRRSDDVTVAVLKNRIRPP
jgi:hypothetical protein